MVFSCRGSNNDRLFSQFGYVSPRKGSPVKAQILEADIPATNGYLNLIDQVGITIKFLNFRTSENFAVIYLKFRKRDQTSGYFVKKMQMK